MHRFIFIKIEAKVSNMKVFLIFKSFFRILTNSLGYAFYEMKKAENLRFNKKAVCNKKRIILLLLLDMSYNISCVND